MLEKNKQEVSDINNAVVQQANGNINNYGLGYNDVKAICHDVIRQELTILTKEAIDAFHQEISAFVNQFVSRLEKLENPQVMEKLKSPKLQLVLHDTIKEYAKTDDVNTKEALVDLFIERLKIRENTTEQNLIDESIKIIPKLSLPQAYFLGALTLRRMRSNGFSLYMENIFIKYGMIYEYLDDISNLDIHYLKLQNCCSDMSGTMSFLPLSDILKRNCDLLFRHTISENDLKNYFHDYPDTQPELIHKILFRIKETNELRLLYSSKEFLYSRINEENLKYSQPELECLLNKFLPFSDNEFREYLISLHPNWHKALNCLNKKEVTHIDVTPIGLYIGKKLIEKVTKLFILPLEAFYKTQL